MREKAISRLGVGPMSSEIIEAAFRYSQEKSVPLMLIASKNQIDWNGGYVNKWTTKEYAEFVSGLKKKYPDAQIFLCRDHCGPGFRGYDLGDVYKTIDDDIGSGFDLIHVDFSHLKGTYQEILSQSKSVIDYILKQAPRILIEVGTDENDGSFLNDISQIEDEIRFFRESFPIHFYVFQTGSLIKEINQIGGFNLDFVRKIREIADKNLVYLKEHNADYLDGEQIAERSGLIDALNIAPQLGVLQTQLSIQKATTYGIDTSNFLNEAYSSHKWEKWMRMSDGSNKFLCAVIAGHYVFSSDAYKKLYEGISQHEDFKETIIQEMMKVFALYLENLS